MEEINFGIIGCGDVTEKKSGPAFQKIKGSKLLAVMRRDEKKLIDYAKRHKVPKYSTNYLDLLEDESIDAIYIATPPNKHHFYTLEAAKYGKAVYVEKPMAMTVTECEEMIKVCKDNNVPLFVAYYRREQEKFKKAKELIDMNEIGEVRAFNYVYTSKTQVIDPHRAWLVNEDISGGGMLYDIGSHMIDMITYLFGDVEMAAGISANQSKVFGVNDVTTGFIKFKNGIQGSIQLTFNGAENRDELCIIGSNGTLNFSIMDKDGLVLAKDGTSTSFTFDILEHVQLPYIKKVVDTLLGKDSYDSTGIYGLRTQEILEAFNKGNTIKYN
jgi:predicted dehydrogenase